MILQKEKCITLGQLRESKSEQRSLGLYEGGMQVRGEVELRRGGAGRGWVVQVDDVRTRSLQLQTSPVSPQSSTLSPCVL